MATIMQHVCHRQPPSLAHRHQNALHCRSTHGGNERDGLLHGIDSASIKPNLLLPSRLRFSYAATLETERVAQRPQLALETQPLGSVTLILWVSAVESIETSIRPPAIGAP
jgi:hypothetical protein